MAFTVMFFYILFGIGKKVLHGVISKNHLHNLTDYYLGNGVLYFFMFFCFLGFAVFQEFPSWITVLLACCNGLLTALFQIFSSRAMSTGSVSLTVLITAFGMIPTLFFTVIFMNDTVSVSQCIGLALLAVTFFLVVKPDKDSTVSLAWLLLVGVAFFSTAGTGIISKLWVMLTEGEGLYWYLVFSSAVATTTAMLMAFSTSRRMNLPPSFKPKSLATLLLFICALTLSASNIFNQYCTILVPGTILFPVGNGAMMVGTMAITAVLFKEKLTRNQWIGVGTGIISLLLICKIFAMFGLNF